MHEVTRTEVQLGAHGAHERGEQGGRHQPEQSRGQQRQHGWVRQVVAHFVLRHVRKRLPEGIQIGKHHQRSQRHQNPRPRTQGVMRHVEQQRGPHGVALIPG